MFKDLILGPVPLKGHLLNWLLREGYEKLGPMLADPTGQLERLGDLLLWSGRQGQHVLVCLEQATESQHRIESVVNGVQMAQMATHASLGSLYSLSILGLGLTSLSGVYMAMRMSALHRRLEQLQQRLKDIEANLQAKDKAWLLSGIAALQAYEENNDEHERRSAKASSLHAVKLYGQLLEGECRDGAPRRLPVMDYYGRCYMVALATEIRCYLLADDELKIARKRLDEEELLFNRAAKVAFQEVLGRSPERFLDPAMQPHHVTLDLLSEIYRQAHRIGAVEDRELATAGELFEHFRGRIFGARRGGGWVFSPGGQAASRMMANLRHLMTCLEETGRIAALKLRIEEAIRGGHSLRDLERWLRDLASGTTTSQFNAVAPSTVFAFRMP